MKAKVTFIALIVTLMVTSCATQNTLTETKQQLSPVSKFVIDTFHVTEMDLKNWRYWPDGQIELFIQNNFKNVQTDDHNPIFIHDFSGKRIIIDKETEFRVIEVQKNMSVLVAAVLDSNEVVLVKIPFVLSREDGYYYAYLNQKIGSDERIHFNYNDIPCTVDPSAKMVKLTWKSKTRNIPVIKTMRISSVNDDEDLKIIKD